MTGLTKFKNTLNFIPVQPGKRKSDWIKDVFLNVVLPLMLGTAVYFFVYPPPEIFKWIRYYFPDGAWAWALASAVLIIHERRPPLVWMVLCFVLAAVLEGAQYYGWIAGTADMLDIAICYICMASALLLNTFFRKRFYQLSISIE